MAVEELPQAVVGLLMGGDQHRAEAEQQSAAQSSGCGGISETGGKKSQGKRRQVSFACASCAHAKAKCDDKRPCSRCIRLHRQDLCIDVAVKKAQQEQQQTVAPVAEPKAVDLNGRKRASRIEKFQTRGFACQGCWTAKVFCDRQRPCSRCASRNLCCTDRPGVTPLDEESNKLVIAPANKDGVQEPPVHPVPSVGSFVGSKRKMDSDGFTSDEGSEGWTSPTYERMKDKGSMSPPECFTPPPCGAGSHAVSVMEAVAKISGAAASETSPINSPPLTKRMRLPSDNIEELSLDGQQSFASETKEATVLPSISELVAQVRAQGPIKLPGIQGLSTSAAALPLPLPLPPLFGR